jgi:hypothetical protein
MLTVIEIGCYVTLYQHITDHNKSIVASKLLDPSVIRIRNKFNSISLVGQVLSWFMEVWYIVLIGFLSNIFHLETLREVAPFFKTFEFFLVPLVQIHTSPPIRKFNLAKYN